MPSQPRPILDRIMDKVTVSPGPLATPCWLFTGARAFGYGYICSDIKGGSPKRVHRAMWEIQRGTIPPGKMVLHNCDVKHCCNPDHLYVGDHADNTRDAVERHRYRAGDANGARTHPERHARGEASCHARITEAAVRSMREEFDSGRATVRQLADRLGLEYFHVNLVVKRRRWKHV